MRTPRDLIGPAPTIVALIGSYFLLLSIEYYGILFGAVKISLINLLELQDYLNVAIDLLSWQVPLLTFYLAISYLFVFLAFRLISWFEKTEPTSKKWISIRNFYRHFLNFVGEPQAKTDAFLDEAPLNTYITLCVSFLFLLGFLAVLFNLLFYTVGPSQVIALLRRLTDHGLMKVFAPDNDAENTPAIFRAANTFIVLALGVVVSLFPIALSRVLTVSARLSAVLCMAMILSFIATAQSAEMQARPILLGTSETITIVVRDGESKRTSRLDAAPIAYIGKGILAQMSDKSIWLVKWDSIVNVVERP